MNSNEKTYYTEGELFPLIKERLRIENLSAVVIMESVSKSGARCVRAGCDRLYSVAEVEKIICYIERRSLVERDGFFVLKAERSPCVQPKNPQS